MSAAAQRQNLAIVDRRVAMGLGGRERIRGVVDSVAGRVATVRVADALLPAITRAIQGGVAAGDVVELERPRGVAGALQVVAVLQRSPAVSGGTSSASIDFTDGETSRRVTITDATVTATSAIAGSVMRPDVTEDEDPGYLYVATVVARGAGSFDLMVLCLDWGGVVPDDDPPDETVTFVYTVS